MNYTETNPLRFNTRPLLYFIGWWVRTLFFAAIAPFAFFGLIFWVAWLFDGLSSADVHEILVALASSATPQEWEAGSKTWVIALALPMAVVIAWRFLTSNASHKLSDYIEVRSRDLMLRGLEWLNPKWATEDNAGAALLLLPTIVFVGVFSVLFNVAPINTASPELPITPVVREPIASAAISLSDREIMSGTANIVRDGDRWIIEFDSQQAIWVGEKNE